MDVRIKATYKTIENLVAWRILEEGCGKVDESARIVSSGIENGCLYTSIKCLGIEYVEPLNNSPFSVNDFNQLQNLFGTDCFLIKRDAYEIDFNLTEQKFVCHQLGNDGHFFGVVLRSDTVELYDQDVGLRVICEQEDFLEILLGTSDVTMFQLTEKLPEETEGPYRLSGGGERDRQNVRLEEQSLFFHRKRKVKDRSSENVRIDNQTIVCDPKNTLFSQIKKPFKSSEDRNHQNVRLDDQTSIFNSKRTIKKPLKSSEDRNH